MVVVDHGRGDQRSDEEAMNQRPPGRAEAPGDREEEQSGHQFDCRITQRYRAPAAPAMSTQPEIGKNRNIVPGLDLRFTRGAM